MFEFISTFTTGFGDVVKEQLEYDLPGAKVIDVYDGLIYFRYNENYNNIKKIIFLNNTFSVMNIFRGKNLDFNKMANQACKEKHNLTISTGSFRVRFSRENQFVKVDKNIIMNAEKHIIDCSSLRIDRLSPTTEIWYIIRSEGIGFYCQLIFKRKATEKNLNKGELRPEFAYLMCLCAELPNKSIVCDPFCGYGVIAKQLLIGFKVEKVIASDIDKAQIMQIKNAKWANNRNFVLSVADATKLVELRNDSVDAVITDPPWGYFEKIDNIEAFYIEMLRELLRITKKKGTIVILSARKEEFIRACEECKIIIINRVNTLVNGKKASVFIIKK